MSFTHDRATITDVARAANVGLATASRALNGRRGVSSATAQNVLETAARLGYVPNRMARQLRSRRSGVVGLLVASLGNPSYELYVRGAVQAAGQLGFSMFICDAEYDDDLYRTHLRRLLEHQVDGLIVSEQIVAPELLDPYHAAGITVDPDPADPAGEFGAAKRISMRAAFMEAYGDLARMGHRRLAYVKVARPGAPPRPRSEERIQMLRDAFAKTDHATVELWDVPGQAGVEEYVANSLSQPEGPTALVVSSMALHGVLLAVERLRIEVPGALSIICVGEVPWSRFCRPALSTVGSDQFERGTRAARRVIGTLMSDPDLVSRNEAPPFRYVRRDSVGPPSHGKIAQHELRKRPFPGSNR